MYIWLTQRAEPSPHDSIAGKRLMRTGLMADSFVDSGIEVDWWTSDFDHFGNRVRGYGTATIPVRNGYNIRYLESSGYEHSRSLKRLRSDADIAKSFTREANVMSRLPDVIIASMPSVDMALQSALFGKAHDIPVIIDIRDLHPDLFIEMAPPIVKPFARAVFLPMRRNLEKACRLSDAIWGNTDGFVEWGCKAAGRARQPSDKSFPIGIQPITLTQEQQQKIDAKWDKKDLFRRDEFNIVFFGRFSKSFDFRTIFDAAQTLEGKGTKHRFYFFGHGPQEVAVSKYCEDHANSHYLGWTGPEDLQAAMSRSQIGLAPYLPIANYTQNLPNKPTEYLSGGLGVATSLQKSVLTDLLHEGGSGFNYEDADDLVLKLCHLEKDPNAMQNMKDAALMTFNKKFETRALSKAMIDAVQQIRS